MTPEIPESIARPNEDFAWLDSQCNIAENQLSPEEGLYVLDLKTNENISKKIEEKDFSEKTKEYFEQIFKNKECEQLALNILKNNL